MNVISKPPFADVNGSTTNEVDAFLDRLFPTRSIRKVLLINPPDADGSMFRLDTALRGRYTNYPPYGLAMLAAKLREIGVEVQISNLNHEILKEAKEGGADGFDFEAVWRDKLDTVLADFKPDLVGVTCMFTMTHTSFRKVCEQVTSAGIPLAIGGVHVTNDVERVLDDVPYVNIAFLREGEVALQLFVRVVNTELPVDDLAQIVLNDGNERYHFPAECTPKIEDIEVLPAYDLLDVSDYARFGVIGAFYCFKPEGTRFATVLSNRGCRARCTFCSVRNFNGSGVRQRSITSVVDELELLQDHYGVGHIMWLDDDLLKDHKRAIGLFNEIIKRRLDITWDATNGVIAASCTDEVMAAAAASGCIAINIGMESGNPQILREVKKPGKVETFLKAAEVLRKYEEIHTSVFLMIGFPNETMDMILDTINVAREMDLDWYRVSQLQPLPNTPIYDSMVEQGIIEDVGSKELRFMGGAYGKQTEIEQGLRMASLRFEEAFASIPLDAVPSADQLTDIWFYMNYHLNFHRLFTEENSVKIRQQLAHLRVLGDIISPENGFALYFLGYMQHKIHGDIDPEILERLRERLATSDYWRDRFQAFGLSYEDLENREFNNKHIPRILPGQLPRSTASEQIQELDD